MIRIRILLSVFLFAATLTSHSYALTLEGGAKKVAPVGGGTDTGAPPTITNAPPENLHPYLTDNGRGFDRCRYEKDHPNADTQNYGKPQHFGPGKPMGDTTSVNGQSPKYMRCAPDPCHPGGTQCWKNPDYKFRTIDDQIDDNLRIRGCKQQAGGRVICPHPQAPAGADAAFYPKYKNQEDCYRTATGIGCNTGTGGGHKKSAPKTAAGDPFSPGKARAPLSGFFDSYDPKNPNNNAKSHTTGQLYKGNNEPKRYDDTLNPGEAAGQLYQGNVDPGRYNSDSGPPQVDNSAPPGSYLQHPNPEAPGSYLQQHPNEAAPGSYLP